MEKHFQTICNIENYYRDSYVDMSSFKNGSFCILYEDWIDYYSKHYEYFVILTYIMILLIYLL